MLNFDFDVYLNQPVARLPGHGLFLFPSEGSGDYTEPVPVTKYDKGQVCVTAMSNSIL